MTEAIEMAQPLSTHLVRGLVRGVAVAFVVTLAALCGVLVLVDSAQWWRGLLAGAAVSLLAAGMSLPPLMWGLRRGVDKAAAGYFIAMGARSAVSLGGCLVAVMIGGYPATPTLLLMVVFYFVLLAVETTFVARALWTAKG
jgi:hypothetical protein